jgi:thiamine-phosphate pyrophosphorylase
MHPPVLRILDANANRAREALRVIEDYARFILNDKDLCAQLKVLRHDLAAALGPILPRAIQHRDTPGDVGTDTKTAAEMQRLGVDSITTAAGKRMGEALRAVEEYLKIDFPDRAAAIESIRYRFYDLEMRIVRTLRPGQRFNQVRLYVLITERLCHRPWLETAELAIQGGADCIQLREKDLEGAELLRRARRLVELCRRTRTKADANLFSPPLCIINDRADIAMISGADGVHVGQQDLPAVEVRKLVGTDMLIGVSTHNLDQARQAVRDGADYIGVGPVFPSRTKPRDFLPGLDYARQAAAEISLPSVAIAGITEENLDSLLVTGIKTIAVTAAVISQPDPRAAAERLRRKLI